MRCHPSLGIPINGSLLPALPGFELTTGIDLNYDEDVDYYCTGSSTTKPICQLYGNAKVHMTRMDQQMIPASKALSIRCKA